MRSLFSGLAWTLVALIGLSASGCLRTPYNRCTEMPPERECELLDGGVDAGPDAGVDSSAGDTGPASDASSTADAGLDGDAG